MGNQNQSSKEEIMAKDLFMEEMKKTRLFCTIKLIVCAVLFLAGSLFITKSAVASILLMAIFMIVIKFVKIGSSYVDVRVDTGEIVGNHGFGGFIAGLIVVILLVLGLDKLNTNLFPPYFFILPFFIVVGLAIWLFSPVLTDIYLIIESTLFLKAPPQEDYFVMSEYIKGTKVEAFRKIVVRVLVGFFLLLISGALVTQTVQYFIESPKLLAELDREAEYAQYSEENLTVPVPQEKFAKPDHRKYKRFKSKCTDTYIFETNNDGIVSSHTVTVTYYYKSEWTITNYQADTQLLSFETSGTWKGLGKDGYYVGDIDQYAFTVVLHKLNETEASGTFICVPPGEPEENGYRTNFTATVEKDVYIDQNGHGQIYYVMTGTTDVPRGWLDSTDLVLKYHVGTDRIVVESNYEAVLHKQK